MSQTSLEDIDEIVSVAENPATAGSTNALRASYVVAKTRASELGSLSTLNIISGSHSVKGAKVYTAIAALLNTSISITAAESLEKYIRKSAGQLPTSIIDLQEWGQVLDLAREKRGSAKKFLNIIGKQKQEYNFLARLSLSASRTCAKELEQMRQGVASDVAFMAKQLEGLHAVMPTLCTQLRGLETGKASLEAENAQLRADLQSSQTDAATFLTNFNRERKTNKALNKQVAELDATVLQLESFLGQKTTQASNLEHKVQDLDADRFALKRNLSTLGHELQVHEQHEHQLEDKVHEEEEMLERLNNMLELSQRSLSDANAASAATEQRLQGELDVLRESGRQTEERLRGDIAALTASEQALRTSKEGLQASEKSLKLQTQQLVGQVAELQKQSKALKDHMVVMEGKFNAQLGGQRKEHEAKVRQLQASIREQSMAVVTPPATTTVTAIPPATTTVTAIPPATTTVTATPPATTAATPAPTVKATVDENVNSQLIREMSEKAVAVVGRQDLAARAEAVGPNATQQLVEVVVEACIGHVLSKLQELQAGGEVDARSLTVDFMTSISVIEPGPGGESVASGSFVFESPRAAADGDEDMAAVVRDVATDYMDFILGCVVSREIASDSTVDAEYIPGSSVRSGSYVTAADTDAAPEGTQSDHVVDTSATGLDFDSVEVVNVTDVPNSGVEENVEFGRQDVFEEDGVPEGGDAAVLNTTVGSALEDATRSRSSSPVAKSLSATNPSNNVVSVTSDMVPGSSHGLNGSSSGAAVGMIVMPTFTQYLEDVVNRIYDRHEGGPQNPQEDNPAAEALQLLQEIRLDVEIMRSNILLATVRECETNLPTNAPSPLPMKMRPSVGDKGVVAVTDTALNATPAPTDVRAMEFLACARNCVGNCRLNIDAIRKQCTVNQDAVRKLDGMVRAFSTGTEISVSADDLPSDVRPSVASSDRMLASVLNSEDTHSHHGEYQDDISTVVSGMNTGDGSFDDGDNAVEEAVIVTVANEEVVRPAGVTAKSLPVDSINLRSLVLLQAVVRGFCGRRRVAHKRTLNNAVEQGVLAAALGTKQGETGWYSCQGMLFYFCLHRGDFVLLCGPITDAIYNVACDELEARMAARGPRSVGDGASVGGDNASLGAASVFTLQDLERDVFIDRLAVQATRTQIQLLLDTVRNKDVEIDALRQEVALVKNNTLLDLEELSNRHMEQLDECNRQIKEQKTMASGCRVEMLQTRAQLDESVKRYRELEQRGRMSPRGGAADAGPTMPSGGRSCSAAHLELVPKVSPRSTHKLVKFQARVRGAAGRRKADEKKVLLAAQATGVLIALSSTEQGKSGWYQAPGGDVFYFVRDDQAEWLLAAGPISRGDYDEAIKSTQSSVPASSGVAGGAGSGGQVAGGSGASFAMMRKSGAVRLGPGDVLRRCDFELAVEHEDVQGDVYMANKSNKLFVAVSVDSLLLDSQMAYSSIDNTSSILNEYDTGTIGTKSP